MKIKDKIKTFIHKASRIFLIFTLEDYHSSTSKFFILSERFGSLKLAEFEDELCSEYKYIDQS